MGRGPGPLSHRPRHHGGRGEPPEPSEPIRNSTIQGGISAIAEFGHPDIGGVIERNTIIGGIAIGDDLHGLLIKDNLVTGSTGDGISVIMTGFDGPAPGGTVTIRHNTATGNAGHGFNVTAVPPDSYTDGGSNHASGNGLDPQCIGVIRARH